MKFGAMKNINVTILILCLMSCGESKKDTTVAPKEAPQVLQDNELAGGTYTLSSGSVSYTNNLGILMDPQILQVVGEYTWAIESKGNDKYVVTQTGYTKLNNSNFVGSAIDCRGAQDVVQFEITKSHTVQNIVQLESGCPQGLNLASAANQWTIKSIDENAFVVTLVSQGSGEKYVYTLTFKK